MQLLEYDLPYMISTSQSNSLQLPCTVAESYGIDDGIIDVE